MEQIVYLNTRFIAADEARISVHDAGFLFGAGVFETLLGSRGRLFYFPLHFNRLKDSCRTLGLTLPFSPGSLRRIMLELLTRNQLNGVEARVKIVVTPGDISRHISHRDSTVLITVEPYLRPNPRLPWKLLFDRTVQAGSTTRHKTTSYLPYRMALHAARNKGYDDAILLDRDGMVSETSLASLLLFRDGTLLLPDSVDALPGITRGVVAEIARSNGITVAQRPVIPDTLYDGWTLALCNALLGPFPVSHINDTPLPAWDAALLTLLRTTWAEGAEQPM
ncbi:MAG: aminotransferase class IV [Bacteroidota bacterium]|jgi:branched-subunit amino acid aminotransferase/4-amino-4-deoxychorismate lyase|nr:aminotransferase class IV [Bacteroidota bacterium]